MLAVIEDNKESKICFLRRLDQNFCPACIALWDEGQIMNSEGHGSKEASKEFRILFIGIAYMKRHEKESIRLIPLSPNISSLEDETKTWLHICHISMHFKFKFLTKIYIFSASDLPRASHWNLKSLRLSDKLRARGRGGQSHRDSPLVWTVTFNCRSTSSIYCIVSFYKKSNVHTVIWSDSLALTGQESSSWQDNDITKKTVNWGNPGLCCGSERVGTGATPTR